MARRDMLKFMLYQEKAANVGRFVEWFKHFSHLVEKNHVTVANASFRAFQKATTGIDQKELNNALESWKKYVLQENSHG